LKKGLGALPSPFFHGLFALEKMMTDDATSGEFMEGALLVAWRRAQRSALLQTRNAIAVVERRQWNARITQLLIEGFPSLQHLSIGIYWPFQGEFDPRFAVRHFRDQGATVALPQVVAKGQPLVFRQWWPGVAMSRGVYVLPVPDDTAVVQPQALLIPPVGFDAQGYRLGYGGGFYDRTLSSLPLAPLKIGVGFELSAMPSIHPQPYDIPLDFMVTEAGIRCFRDDLPSAILQPTLRFAVNG
jgi:5,10-methenyltetrahydrofolate synthetase